jgi:hypothetical protein
MAWVVIVGRVAGSPDLLTRKDSSMSTPPDTIVLIHGSWVTPRSWEHWKSRYEEKASRC